LTGAAAGAPAERVAFAVPSVALVAYLAITFSITWSLIGSYVVFPQFAAATFGKISGSHPVFFVATWAPAIAATAVVLFYAGVKGLRAFVSRLLLWRCSATWWAFIVVGIPVVFITGSLLKGGPVLAPVPAGGSMAVVAMMVVMLLLGPIEEFGWRGVAQPLLQRHMAPIWAGVLIGAIWGLWHLPAFFLAGTVFGDWQFLPFFIGNVALAVLVTPLFNHARGSLLLPMLYHWQLINPVWPDAQPWDTWILVAIAVVVIWWSRAALFSRGGAVTEVLPGEQADKTRPLAAGLADVEPGMR
jgi:uncharacterized protein